MDCHCQAKAFSAHATDQRKLDLFIKDYNAQLPLHATESKKDEVSIERSLKTFGSLGTADHLKFDLVTGWGRKCNNGGREVSGHECHAKRRNQRTGVQCRGKKEDVECNDVEYLEQVHFDYHEMNVTVAF